MIYIKSSDFQAKKIIKIHIILIIFLVVNLQGSPLFALNKSKSLNDLTIQGLLLNQTMTPMGHRFYEDFSSFWTPPEDFEYPNIAITERFNPQWGSLVWISVEDIIVFQKFLSTRNVIMEEVAREAVSTVWQYLLQREILKKYQTSNDLLGDGY